MCPVTRVGRYTIPGVFLVLAEAVLTAVESFVNPLWAH